MFVFARGGSGDDIFRRASISLLARRRISTFFDHKNSVEVVRGT